MTHIRSPPLSAWDVLPLPAIVNLGNQQPGWAISIAGF